MAAAQVAVAAAALASIALLAADSTVARDADALPIPEHTARYVVTQRGRPAGYIDVELRRRDDGGYEYTLTTTAMAMLLRLMGVAISEHGRFQWVDGRIRPISYGQAISRPGPDRFWEAEFDWQAMRARGRSHRGALDVALTPGVLDPLTLRLQLAAQLAAADGAAPAEVFRVLERNRIEAQSFHLRAYEAVPFAAGCLAAARLERLREDDERSYYSWHAAQFHWLPVRIQQLRDGREELDMRLSASTLPLATKECPK